MEMEAGPIVARAIADKYREKLKFLLAEHEFRCDRQGHVSLLIRLCEEVEHDLNKQELN